MRTQRIGTKGGVKRFRRKPSRKPWSLCVLSHLDPASALAVGLLIFAMLLVIAFEATNGFHDAANAVATVIYTKSLKPGQAVVWSGLMNFLGVLLGGISVAYALVELLPADVLSPPSGAPAVGMLVAFVCCCPFLEYRHVVVWAPKFELPLPYRRAHWYSSRQCVAARPQRRA